MTEIKLQCECYNEILQVEEDQGDFWLVVYKHSPVRYSLWRRIKFLFSGHITYNEVALSAENASMLADFINNQVNLIYNVKE